MEEKQTLDQLSEGQKAIVKKVNGEGPSASVCWIWVLPGGRKFLW